MLNLKNLWSLPLAATLLFSSVPTAFAAGGHSSRPAPATRVGGADKSQEPAQESRAQKSRKAHSAKAGKKSKRAKQGRKARKNMKKAAKGMKKATKTRRHGKPASVKTHAHAAR
ncbi:hypothetical protein HY251_01590 [bacterium]|nr:hypothetical protein [bacterium]